MGLEKDIDSTLAAQITTAVDGLITDDEGEDVDVTVRTFWAESAYTKGDKQEDVKYPMVLIASQPSSRDSGHMTQRVVPVDIECATYWADDIDRIDLQKLYAKVRHTIETTAFDFGVNIDYTADSYEIPTPGAIEMADAVQRAAFTVEFNVCASSYE